MKDDAEFLNAYRENLLLIKKARLQADESAYEAGEGYDSMAADAGGQYVGERPRAKAIEEFEEWDKAKSWFDNKDNGFTLDMHSPLFTHKDKPELSFQYETIESIDKALGAATVKLIEENNLQVSSLSANEAKDLFKYTVDQNHHTLALDCFKFCNEQFTKNNENFIRYSSAGKKILTLDEKGLGKLFFRLAQVGMLEDAKKIPVEYISPLAAAQSLQHAVLHDNTQLFTYLVDNKCISKISQDHLNTILSDAALKGNKEMFNALLTSGADPKDLTSKNEEIKESIENYKNYKNEFTAGVSEKIIDGIRNRTITEKNIAAELENFITKFVGKPIQPGFANKIKPVIIQKDFKLGFVENFKAFINSWLEDKPFGDAQKDMLATKFTKLYEEIQKTDPFKKMQRESAKQKFVDMIAQQDQQTSQGLGGDNQR
ncbi:MAG: ankyrin repeat domain-containing protein [Candidatus Jidaibacter sp.]|jgi:hypothetical protein|nr:ankyrin repeat domain-containing protein [Candidatus Jidaibacter sp.]